MLPSTVGFDLWLKEVDTSLAEKYGTGHYDLPDAPWRDWYDDGVSPSEAADLYDEEGWIY